MKTGILFDLDGTLLDTLEDLLDATNYALAAYGYPPRTLPELRRLDDTRLVLYNSGRWDRDPAVGSLSNPGTSEWQNLWGYDGEKASPEGDLGDIHYYPNSVPLQKQADRESQRYPRT